MLQTLLRPGPNRPRGFHVRLQAVPERPGARMPGKVAPRSGRPGRARVEVVAACPGSHRTQGLFAARLEVHVQKGNVFILLFFFAVSNKRVEEDTSRGRRRGFTSLRCH